VVSAIHSAAVSAANAPRPCIAILLGAPLNAQNLERVGIPYLSPHADIVVFDCKPWLGRSETGLQHEAASWDAVEFVDSPATLEQALRRHRPDYALDFIGLGTLTPLLQRLLAVVGTRFVVQKSGTLPQPSLRSRIVWKLRARLARVPATAGSPPINPVPAASKASPPAAGLLARLVQRLTAIFRLRLDLLAPDLALLAGSASLNHFTRRAQHILWVGSQDYHICRLQQAGVQDGLPIGAYAVFIDDNMPYASDWSLLGLPAPVTPEPYYRAMRRMLEQVEVKWGMPVVIAAHPSSRHDERVQQGFGGRVLYHGRTAELVRGAQAVLLHGSTAVSFAVLGNRPLLFLTSGELQRSAYGLHIATMAAELGHAPLDIDSDQAPPDLAAQAARPGLYAQYTDRYLCRTGSAEAGPWKAFIDHIRATTHVQRSIVSSQTA